MYKTRLEVCQSSPYEGICGIYATECSGSFEDLTSVNTIESLFLSGNSSGTFIRSYKVYSTAAEERCNTLLIESWIITGTYQLVGASTCGGTCSNANATVMNVTSASIFSILDDTIQSLNVRLQQCDHITSYSLIMPEFEIILCSMIIFFCLVRI